MKKHKGSRAIVRAASFALLASAAGAQAATVSWNSTTGSWESSSWTGGSGSSPPTSADTARVVNNGTVSYTSSSGTRTVAALVVGTNTSPNKGNGTLTISGGTLSITGDLTISDQGNQNGTVNISGGTLIVGGNVVDGGNGTNTLALSGTGTLDLTNGNTSFLTFNGGTLKNLGTYGAAFAQSAGELQVTTGNATTISGNYTMSGTAALNLSGGSLSVVDFTHSAGAVTGSSTSFSVSGNFANSASIAATNTFNLTGNFSGQNATGTATIASDLALTAATHTFDIANGGTTEFTGVISGATAAVNKITGTGALTFSGIGSNTYGGSTTIAVGTLNLNKSGTANAIAGSLVISGGSTVAYTGSSTDQIANTSTVTISSGTLNIGSNTDTIAALVNAGTVSGSGTLTVSGNFTNNTGATYNSAPSITMTPTAGTTTQILGSATAITGLGVLTVNGGDAASTVQVGGSITGSSAILAVALNLQQGQLDLNGRGLVLSGNATLASGTTVLSTTAGGSLNIAGNLTNNGATFSNSPSMKMSMAANATSQILGSASSLSGLSTLLVAGANNTNSVLQLGGSLAGSAAVSVTNLQLQQGLFDLNGRGVAASGNVVMGSGTTILSTTAGGSLSVGGNLVNNGGTILNSIDITFATAATSQVQGFDVSGIGKVTRSGTGTLDISGRALGVSSVVLTGGTITDVAGGGKITASNSFDVQAGIVNAVLDGGAGLTKSTGSTVTLSSSNLYTGDTKISGGKLKLGASNRIANSSRLVLDGGTFDTGGNSETMAAVQLTDNSTIDLAGGNSVLQFDDSSAQAWTGGKTITILNWDNNLQGTGSDRIYFGTAFNGLTGGQVNQIQFVDPVGMAPGTYGATILSDGQVVAPEPASLSLLVLSGSGLLARRRRKV
jgi:autotransporter-associated beta strand protein